MAIAKALNNRNAAEPRGLKSAASFQGLSLIARPFDRRPCRRSKGRACLPYFVSKESEDDAFL
jgi:hypothetical protein